MNLGAKLFVGLMGLALLMSVVGFVAFKTNRTINHEMSQLAESNLPMMECATGMALTLQRLLTETNDLMEETYRGIVAPKERVRVVAIRKEIAEALKDFKKRLVHMRETVQREVGHSDTDTDEEKKEFLELEKLEENFALYEKHLHQFLDLIKVKPLDADKFLEETLEPYVHGTLIPAIKEHKEDSAEEVLQAAEETQLAITSANKEIIILTVGLLLLAVFFSFLFSRWVSVPIVKLKEATVDIAQGKMDIKINVKSGDEIGELAGSFNSMADSIQKKNEEIQASNKELQTINEEFQTINEELQFTTEELEANNEELKSTNEELSKTYGELENKTTRLERFQAVTVERAMDMVKLKEEVNELLVKMGQPKKYEAPDKIKEKRG